MASDHKTSSTLPKVEYHKIETIIAINELKDIKRSSCNIYKVPFNLCKENEKAYTPQFISIGPLHFRKPHLNPMQDQKLKYYQFFWERVSNNGYFIERHKDYLASQELAIRHCYNDKFPEISTEEFVDMLLLDSVFIVELFLRISELIQMKKDERGCAGRGETTKKVSVIKKEKEKKAKCVGGPKHLEEDWILKQTWLLKSVQRDLLLLENQIPMYILDELYKIIPRNVNNEMPNFIDLARCYFACYDPRKSKSSKHSTNVSICGSMKKSSGYSKCKEEQGRDAVHFTDLIRYFYLCENLDMKPASNNVLRTATKLQEAGVSFKKVTEEHLLNIKFQKHPYLTWFLCLGCILNHFEARFRIPQLKVDNTTECVLRNLIFFEQCHYADQPYVCNYVSLIDSLIHTKDDVELLVEKEVIVHELGSDKEVATLVNGLCKHVVTDSTCYRDIIEGLNTHYQNDWNRTMAALRLVYFRDTWRASSTLVGIAVLVFTIFNFCRVIRVVF